MRAVLTERRVHRRRCPLQKEMRHGSLAPSSGPWEEMKHGNLAPLVSFASRPTGCSSWDGQYVAFSSRVLPLELRHGLDYLALHVTVGVFAWAVANAQNQESCCRLGSVKGHSAVTCSSCASLRSDSCGALPRNSLFFSLGVWKGVSSGRLVLAQRASLMLFHERTCCLRPSRGR